MSPTRIATAMLGTNKRYYETAAIRRDASGFIVLVGERPLRTPGRAILHLPTAALAAAVANEWLSQGEALRPSSMPLTRLAATATDRIASHRQGVIDAVVRYTASDLLCYRADAPEDLVALQQRTWQPLLEWAESRWGANMRVAFGVLPIEQSPATIDALRRAVDRTSDLELAALSSVVQASGSIIVGLAVLDTWIDAETAAATASLDERYQAERWGVDAEAERRRRDIANDIRAAASFLELARA